MNVFDLSSIEILKVLQQYILRGFLPFISFFYSLFFFKDFLLLPTKSACCLQALPACLGILPYPALHFSQDRQGGIKNVTILFCHHEILKRRISMGKMKKIVWRKFPNFFYILIVYMFSESSLHVRKRFQGWKFSRFKKYVFVQIFYVDPESSYIESDVNRSATKRNLTTKGAKYDCWFY